MVDRYLCVKRIMLPPPLTEGNVFIWWRVDHLLCYGIVATSTHRRKCVLSGGGSTAPIVLNRTYCHLRSNRVKAPIFWCYLNPRSRDLFCSVILLADGLLSGSVHEQPLSSQSFQRSARPLQQDIQRNFDTLRWLSKHMFKRV